MQRDWSIRFGEFLKFIANAWKLFDLFPIWVGKCNKRSISIAQKSEILFQNAFLGAVRYYWNFEIDISMIVMLFHVLLRQVKTVSNSFNFYQTYRVNFKLSDYVNNHFCRYLNWYFCRNIKISIELNYIFPHVFYKFNDFVEMKNVIFGNNTQL